MGHKNNSDKFLNDIIDGKFADHKMINIVDPQIWFIPYPNNQLKFDIQIFYQPHDKHHAFRVLMAAHDAKGISIMLEFITMFQESAILIYHHWKTWVLFA